jgi:hypothetical protein
MHDLHNLSILVHIRIDVQDRVDNLEIVMDYFHKNCTNVQFVIINDDKSPDNRLKKLHSKYGNTSKFLFQENSGEYHRTRALNEASKHTDREYLIAGDTDVIVHPDYIASSIQYCNENKNTGGIYPYNGLFIHVSEDHKKTIKKSKSIDFLNKCIPSKENQYPHYKNNDIYVAHTRSVGGCVMYKHDVWNKINGYNPNFVGWGAEDDEINYRMKMLGYDFPKLTDDKAIVWHLPHRSAVRESQPYYEHNLQLRQYVWSLKTKSQMEEYIKTWKL